MPVTAAAARRLSAAAAGIVGALTFAVACSSSSAGKPIPASTAGGSVSAGSSVTAGAPSVSLPSSLPVSLPSSLPSIGNSNNPFCKELRGANLSQIGVQGGASGLAEIIKEWDRLADRAPGDIKSQVKAVDSYLHGLASGHPDASKAQQLLAAVQTITSWIATHCA